MANLEREVEKTASGTKFLIYAVAVVPGMLLCGAGYRMATHPGSTVTLVALVMAVVFVYGISKVAESWVLDLND
jgi:hypothetical protein